MATLRRSSAKLRSLGSGHSDLIVAISQLKELRSATKAMVTAQESWFNDLAKWSSKEENLAIRDVTERICDLSLLWTEAIKTFTDELKDIRTHFEVVLEEEKVVDNAKMLVDNLEAKEVRLRKEEKKLRKRSCPDSSDLRDVEMKLAKVMRDKDYAELEAQSKVKDKEVGKCVRVKDALSRMCRSQLALWEKNQVIFSAASEVVDQMPSLENDSINEDEDIFNLRYQGSSRTLQIVLQTRNALEAGQRAVRRSTSQLSLPPNSPPSYEELQRQLPTNPYFSPSYTPDGSFTKQ